MQVEILTPDKTLFTGTAEIITFPGTGGSFQVKENHAAMISSLVKGILEVQSANETVKFDINGGLVEVLSNKVVVLV